MLSIGLMSGTSMDGIDAALLKTDGTPQKIELLDHYSYSYPKPFKVILKALEYAVRELQGDLEACQQNINVLLKKYLRYELQFSEQQALNEMEHLSQYLYGRTSEFDIHSIIEHSTKLHCYTVSALIHSSHYKIQDLDVIGYPGQTLYHQPLDKKSIILGDAQRMSNHFGVPVVTDFRAHDILSGGQGAPFAPLYHLALTQKDKTLEMPLAVVNCGGIANVTLIFDDDPMTMMAMDTGPGNGLLDRFVKKRTLGRESMDYNGQYGLKGHVNSNMLNHLWKKGVTKNEKNYFDMLPPKSLDIGDLKCVDELDALSLEDACATLAVFTAQTIVQSVNNAKVMPKTWILAGGGWKNPAILENLKKQITQHSKDAIIRTADEVNWHSTSLEAQIFAFLAVRSLKKWPLSYPGTTGVPAPTTGGRVFYSNSACNA